jgi:1-acyl-sn-glycerol-3-phosphate acyltransferase
MKMSGYTRAVIKFPFFAFTLMIYFLASTLVALFCGFNFERARPYLTKIIAIASKIALKIIGVKIVQSFHYVDPDENYLIVSNHLSYLDVLVISSFFPSCFITSKEMKDTFFLGQICLLGGCLFVDRRNRENLHNEVKELTGALDNGLNVAIFPEATSTDGSSVIRFRRPLFQSAIDSHSKVLPICLNYRTIDSTPVTLKNRDIVFWYGDMTFFDHIFKLFSFKKMIVELNVLPSLIARDFADKNILADKCYELVNAQYENIIA